MKHKGKIFSLAILLLLLPALIAFRTILQSIDEQIISYRVNPKLQDVQLYWKNDKGEIFKSIQNLKTYVEDKHKTLLFAMNGGMYKQDYSPLGLFIRDGKTISPLNTASGSGNFYMEPNGVFCITEDNIPGIYKTSELTAKGKMKYATQSGPMLVVDGNINPAFKDGSKNINIRNGVGILPDNEIVFAISKSEINFFDFATYFKNLGCSNALYLDGYVSRAYIPDSSWKQTDGNFGVIIGVTKKE